MKYFVEVTLVGNTDAEDEDEVLDYMLDIIENRDGLEVASHNIRESTFDDLKWEH